MARRTASGAKGSPTTSEDVDDDASVEPELARRIRPVRPSTSSPSDRSDRRTLRMPVAVRVLCEMSTSRRASRPIGRMVFVARSTSTAQFSSTPYPRGVPVSCRAAMRRPRRPRRRKCWSVRPYGKKPMPRPMPTPGSPSDARAPWRSASRASPPVIIGSLIIAAPAEVPAMRPPRASTRRAASKAGVSPDDGRNTAVMRDWSPPVNQSALHASMRAAQAGSSARCGESWRMSIRSIVASGSSVRRWSAVLSPASGSALAVGMMPMRGFGPAASTKAPQTASLSSCSPPPTMRSVPAGEVERGACAQAGIRSEKAAKQQQSRASTGRARRPRPGAFTVHPPRSPPRSGRLNPPRRGTCRRSNRPWRSRPRS